MPRREGSRIGRREKPGCAAVTTVPQLTLGAGGFRAGMTPAEEGARPLHLCPLSLSPS